MLGVMLLNFSHVVPKRVIEQDADSQYVSVLTEQCSQLGDSTSLFDFLLPCADYSSNPVDFYCLSGAETDAALESVPEWVLIPNEAAGDSIRRTYEFPDFQHAFLFMAQSAQLAEKNQHHPDWRNLYNTVEVTLTTDDKACLSTFDIQLAKGMDHLYAMNA
jgi:4a-hydroxytetrahydrobiopterin dehydratase